MSNKPSLTTVVLGASPKPERHSNQAVRMLSDYGHRVLPVHPLHSSIEGLPAAKSLKELTASVDTVTVYLNPKTTAGLVRDLVTLSPRRVIFNPGAEAPEAAEILHDAGIECVNACTLVMLRTGQF